MFALKGCDTFVCLCVTNSECVKRICHDMKIDSECVKQTKTTMAEVLQGCEWNSNCSPWYESRATSDCVSLLCFSHCFPPVSTWLTAAVHQSDGSIRQSHRRGDWAAPPISLLRGGSWKLIGQRVPSFHLLAFVLQTVYPLLESLALWVTAQGHASCGMIECWD